MAFRPLEKLIYLYDGYIREHRIGSHSLLLIQQEGKLYLIRNSCPHKQFPLHTGSVHHGVLTCAYHGMKFDLASRRCLQHPTSRSLCLEALPLIYQGNEVGVNGDDFIESVCSLWGAED